MKKLLGGIAAVGVLCVFLLIASGRKPNNAILAISVIEHPRYGELIVLKRDHTYEQLVRITDAGKETIIGHSGTWEPTRISFTGTHLPAKNEKNSDLFDASVKMQVEDHIEFKKMLRDYGKGGALQEIDSTQPPSGMSPPSEEKLKKWKQWRGKAKPYDAESEVIKVRNYDPNSAY